MSSNSYAQSGSGPAPSHCGESSDDEDEDEAGGAARGTAPDEGTTVDDRRTIARSATSADGAGCTPREPAASTAREGSAEYTAAPVATGNPPDTAEQDGTDTPTSRRNADARSSRQDEKSDIPRRSWAAGSRPPLEAM